MKKFFTLCAFTFLVFSLSAQESEHNVGSSYLTFNVSSLGNNISPSIGIAFVDNLVLSGSVTGGATGLKSLYLDFNVRYYSQVWQDFFLQLHLADPINTGINNLSISIGKFYALDAISDKLYIESAINYDLNSGLYTSVGFGACF